MFDDCIIMAGGSGTRLWPASSSAKPKQFLPVSAGTAGKTFFHTALERALAVTAEQVIVIAGEHHVPHIITACGSLAPEAQTRITLIPEPSAKNTAAAIACGITYADRRFRKNRNILVLTSDHLITPLEVFQADAETAAQYAQQEQLVVFGIPPTAPETGYGYIETASALAPAVPAPETLAPEVYRTASFREKPDRPTAERFLATGGFYWNSGMFAFSSIYMRAEFRRNAGDVIAPFDALEAPRPEAYTVRQGVRVLSAWAGLDQAYAEAKPISFDYAIAEKCAQTVMVAARFGWRDIGSWDEYAQLLGDTGAEVYQTGTGGASCFVDADIPVALCGVDDLIVVIRSGKALIAKKGETQGVREIVEHIKRADRSSLL